MYVNFYDNQEAMERSFLALGLFLWAAGFSFLGCFFLWVGLQVEDEERAIEEQLLDSGEPTLHYTLTLQRDIAASHFNAKGTLFGDNEEENVDFLETYINDDHLWEKERLAEVYEIPISIILSNSYYLVPSSESLLFFNFLWEARHQLQISQQKQSTYLGKLYGLRLRRPSALSFFWPEIPWLLRTPESIQEIREYPLQPWQHSFLGVFPYIRPSRGKTVSPLDANLEKNK